MKIAILGAGMIGAPMAGDLSREKEFQVTSVDISGEALDQVKSKHPGVETLQRDLSRPEEVSELAADFDLVINAVPGYLGFRTARAVIEAGRNCVCIAFYEEDPFELDGPAREKNVTMVMDCGVYPGMGSALIMDAAGKLDEVERVLTYVGGLPENRESGYKAPFSPLDVIEEYVRPARYIEKGVEVVRPALSDPEFIDFPVIGTLEAFNTDGLRTLARTLAAPNMKEKTLRYPGHIAEMSVLRDMGFFSKEKNIELQGRLVSPRELTSRVLFPRWKYGEGEVDVTILKSIVEGLKNGRRTRFTIDLHDRACPETGVSSMARTTGYTATLVARMIAGGIYTRKGISPPEYLGKDPAWVDYLLQGLKERGVNWEVSEAEI